MKSIFGTWIVDCLALIIADGLLEGIWFADNRAIILTALALALLDAFVKPVLKVLALPITFITFGLFSLFINGAVLMMAFRLSQGSGVSSMPVAILASLIVSFVGSVFGVQKE